MNGKYIQTQSVFTSHLQKCLGRERYLYCWMQVAMIWYKYLAHLLHSLCPRQLTFLNNISTVMPMLMASWCLATFWLFENNEERWKYREKDSEKSQKIKAKNQEGGDGQTVQFTWKNIWGCQRSMCLPMMVAGFGLGLLYVLLLSRVTGGVVPGCGHPDYTGSRNCSQPSEA